MIPALIAMALLQIADVVTTLRFLERGGREKNKVIRWMMDELGEYGWIGVKLIGTGAAGIALYNEHWPYLLWAINFFYAYVVYRNTKVNR